MDIHVGDIVHVRGTVYDTLPSSVLVDFSSDEKSDVMWVRTSSVVHVEPRPIKVGDRVKSSNLCIAGAVVLAVDGDWAWLKWKCGSPDSWLLSDLTRIEGEPS